MLIALLSIAGGEPPISGFRVYIGDPELAEAATDALAGASEWLDHLKCQTIFSEFVDESGAPLRNNLNRLEVTPQDYLRMVVFVDGERHNSCAREGVLAFTKPRSRVVYLCGEFGRVSRGSARDAQVSVIHEVLHTLGLGENPPTSRQITLHVRQRCWQ